MDAYGVGLICDSCGYYAILDGQETEIRCGNIIVELSEFKINDLRKIILSCPYYETTLSVDCGDLSFVHDWLKLELFKIANPIVASVLMAELTSFARRFFLNKNILLDELRHQPDSDYTKIKEYIFHDTGFSDYGFSTVGHFLLSSIQDVYWGLLLINGALNNLATGKEKLVLSSLTTELWGAIAVPCRFVYLFEEVRTVYVIDGLMSVLLVELSKIFENNVSIKKCKNCGKYFIPGNRSDEIYCDKTSPQNPQMTCKEYGSKKLWYDKLKLDDAAKLARNIYMAKQMLVKRNPDIPAYKEMFDYFKSEKKKWELLVKDGKKTREEYICWLNTMKSQKTLK